jgi:hypothetical protein
MDLLIKKPVAPGSVVSFRLSSGEELIATLVSDDGTTFTISKPIHVISRMTVNGIEIIFAPFMVTVDDGGKFTFKHSHIATTLVETKDEVKQSYLASTSSIVPAQAVPGLIR